MEKPQRTFWPTHYIIPSFKILRLAKGRVLGSKVDTGALGTETCSLEILLKESPLEIPSRGTIIPKLILTSLCNGNVSASLTEEN